VIRVEHGDCCEVIPRLVAEGVVADAIVTDPPYHLTSGNIAVDFDDYGPRQGGGSYRGSTNKNARKSGFMSQRWDGGDIAFCPETWAAPMPILRPGGFLVAFGGTRTHHRMVCAIEDAGFVIQDTVAWLYGSGFPKHRSHLKPAFEPICLAYKPGGARTLQIDECRIPGNGEDFGDPEAYAQRSRKKSDGWLRPHHGNDADLDRARAAIEKVTRLGRWPANVCHDGSDEVLAVFPDAPGAFAAVRGDEPSNSERSVFEGLAGRHSPREPIGDGGSAARFFYCAKADGHDRWGSKHPTVKPVELIRWLVQLVCPPGGLFLDPFAGSGTAGVAALATGRNAILIEQDEGYVADIRERLAHYAGDGRHSLASKNRNRRETVGTLL
jgi:site-specific DNA-methyltransferase (adenine-specific)